jgi:hypothetical protein
VFCTVRLSERLPSQLPAWCVLPVLHVCLLCVPYCSVNMDPKQAYYACIAAHYAFEAIVLKQHTTTHSSRLSVRVRAVCSQGRLRDNTSM